MKVLTIGGPNLPEGCSSVIQSGSGHISVRAGERFVYDRVINADVLWRLGLANVSEDGVQLDPPPMLPEDYGKGGLWESVEYIKRSQNEEKAWKQERERREQQT